MSKSLFDEFTKTSSAAWKQKIQVDLKGADYNDTLLWKTNEGIIVKPFYTIEDRTHHQIKTSEKGFNICQSIFVDDEKIANSLALNALNKGANSILFNANKTFNYVTLLKNIDCRSTILYFNFSFLNDDFQIEVSKYFNSENIYFQTDIIGNLAETGNWFKNLKSDYKKLENIVKQTNNCISVSLDLYQNSGANITQQLAYTLAHANEYLNYFGGDVSKKIYFIFSVAGNYFFEIAKIRAFRSLWSSLLEEYKIKNQQAHIFTKPSLRNKTLYDYNVNMLRTTTECMSAILGSSNTISNVSYDAIYHKSNEFGERIARNQLLILQQETGFNNPQKYAEGSYYIESTTQQLTEKSLDIFKSIEKGGGFLKQLKSGIIQKKIKENDAKEKEDLIHKEMILLGTNFHLNKDDEMHQNLELYPFLKQRNIKTLITPIMRNRISEFIERERLKAENV